MDVILKKLATSIFRHSLKKEIFLGSNKTQRNKWEVSPRGKRKFWEVKPISSAYEKEENSHEWLIINRRNMEINSWKNSWPKEKD